MIMKNLIVSITLLTTATIAVAAPVYAGSGNGYTNPCQPYGGGECPPVTIVVNKTVQNPQTKAYVDNLTIADPKYAPNQTVSYHIDVKNPNTIALNNVVVKDMIPANLVAFVPTAGQTYDAKTKTITMTIPTLNAGETKELTVTGKVASDSAFSQTTTCNIENAASVNINGAVDSDTASICVQKPNVVYPTPNVKTTPKTGPEMLGLLGLLPGSLAGIALRRKAYRK